MEQQNLLQQVQSLADDLTRAIHDLLAFYLTDDSFLVRERERDDEHMRERENE